MPKYLNAVLEYLLKNVPRFANYTFDALTRIVLIAILMEAGKQISPDWKFDVFFYFLIVLLFFSFGFSCISYLKSVSEPHYAKIKRMPSGCQRNKKLLLLSFIQLGVVAFMGFFLFMLYVSVLVLQGVIENYMNSG